MPLDIIDDCSLTIKVPQVMVNGKFMDYVVPSGIVSTTGTTSGPVWQYTHNTETFTSPVRISAGGVRIGGSINISSINYTFPTVTSIWIEPPKVVDWPSFINDKVRQRNEADWAYMYHERLHGFVYPTGQCCLERLEYYYNQKKKAQQEIEAAIILNLWGQPFVPGADPTRLIEPKHRVLQKSFEFKFPDNLISMIKLCLDREQYESWFEIEIEVDWLAGYGIPYEAPVWLTQAT